MSTPNFPDPTGRRELLNPGATAHKAGLSLEDRVKALEQAALSRPGPDVLEHSVPTTDFAGVGNIAWTPGAGSYSASMYVANSGAPTHTSNGGWQKVGSGGGSVTWTSGWDQRPDGVSAQLDTANGRIYARRSGLYLVTARVSFTAISDAKVYAVDAYVDGSNRMPSIVSSGVASTPIVTSSEVIQIDSGSYVELYAFQNDSASEAYQVNTSWRNRLTVTYLGPSS